MRQASLFNPALLLDSSGVRVGHGLLVRDGRIVDAGTHEELAQRYPHVTPKKLDRLALLPGTVNAHSHSFQSLLRGISDDLPFLAWRDTLYRIAPRLDDEAVHVAALHAFGEMLRNGITTVVDFFYLQHDSLQCALAVVAAAEDLGIRLVLARAMLDSPKVPDAFRETPAIAVANAVGLAKRVQGARRVSVIPAPHSPHSASLEMIRAGASLARDWETPWHIHLAENSLDVQFTKRSHGRTPLAWLDGLGVIDKRTRIVHGVFVTKEEVAMLARAGGGLVHCPGSNLFLGDGVCPLRWYIAEGTPVSLGCDSGSANSQLSIFGEMRVASLVQKGWARRGDAIDAASVFRMGTIGGADATGLAIGALRIGSCADFVAIALDDLSLLPAQTLPQNVVYSIQPSAIRQVWVDGELVLRDGKLVRIDEQQIAERVRSAFDRLRLFDDFDAQWLGAR